MKKVYFLFVLLWALAQANAQNTHQCDFDFVRSMLQNDSQSSSNSRADVDWWQYWRSIHPEPAHLSSETGVQSRASCVKAKRIIPVAVHVVHSGGADSISESQIENAIQNINDHFSNASNTASPAVNTGFQFVLARTEWVHSGKTHHLRHRGAQLMELGAGIWSLDTFINIWVVHSILSTDSIDTGIMGYSTYPGSSFVNGAEGVVVRYNWFGDSMFGWPVDGMSKGTVLTHEIGHYLGLLHPFEGACAGLNSSDCYAEGDLCCDVPAVQSPSQNCVLGPYNTCEETYNNNPSDQKQNYMDYSLPSCKNTFTADQTKLMNARIAQYRPSLGLPSTEPLMSNKPCMVSALIDGPTAICDTDSLIFSTYDYPGSSYSWTLYKNNVLFMSSTSSHRFAAQLGEGTYSLILHVSNGGEMASDTLLDEIEVMDCSKRLASPKGNWYMGIHAGLNFAPGRAHLDLGPFYNDLDNNQIRTTEGSMSMSDSMGQLLFYGGPLVSNEWYSDQDVEFPIFGKNYLEIQGSPLVAYGSGRQGPLAVPMPDSLGKYLVFYSHSDKPYFLRAVIDPYDSVQDGAGKWHIGRITRRDMRTALPDSATLPRTVAEAMTAVPQCNPKLYWLLVYNSMTGHIVVYKVQGDSVCYHSKFPTNETMNEQLIVFNKQGNLFSFGQSVYRFNRCEGEIELFKEVEPDSSYLVSGVVWSGNGKLLYRNEYNYFDTSTYDEVWNIYQYNSESPDVSMGRKLVASNTGELLMQIGPDDKLYTSTANQPFLGVIEDPNQVNYSLLVNQCGYVPVGVLLRKGLEGGTTFAGSLPNFVAAERESPINKELGFGIFRLNCTSLRVEPNQCCATSFHWDWGDGNTSVNRIDSHTYAANGNYTIQLIVNKVDTLSRQIQIGIPSSHTSPSGPDTVCYGNIEQEFYGPNADLFPYYYYKWVVSAGVLQSQQRNAASIVFDTGTCSVKMIITDTRSLCVDSGTINVRVQQQVTNNFIDSSQIVCDTSELKNIHGSQPIGGNGVYSYRWYYRNYDSTEWKVWNGVNGQHAEALRDTNNYHYVRTVISGSCLYESNQLGKVLLSNVGDIVSKHNGCKETFELRDTQLYGLQVIYQWQVSQDSVNFVDIQNSMTNRIDVDYNANEEYYRLKITYQGCSVYSNVLKHWPEILLLEHPQGTVACGEIPFVLRVKVRSPLSCNYTWQFQNDNADWVDINDQGEDSLKSLVNWPNYRQFRVKISTECGGVYYSNEANVGAYANPSIVEMDSSRFANSGVPIRLKGQWLGERNVCSVLWQRSKNPVGAIWEDLDSTKSDSFTVTPFFTQCQQRWYYRLILHNKCPNDSNSTQVSETVEVYGFQQPFSFGDAWIPDSPADDGNEPNWEDEENFTHSHRLWNRQRSTIYKLVWKWEDREEFKTDIDTNFIHTMVYNRGNAPISDANLFFYWTVMSVNEDWPFSWTGMARFVNQDNNSLYYQDTFPLGGRINKTAIHLSTFLNQSPAIASHPPYGGLLQPGDSVLVTYPWGHGDTIPQPGWYYGIVNGQKRYANKIGMCILARLTTCDSPNYGMTYPEKIHNTNLNGSNNTGYRGNIGYNIIRNNNIVSTNFYLGYMSPPFSDTTQVWILAAAKKPEHGSGTGQRELKYSLCADDPAFFNHGEVVITLPDDYWVPFSAVSYPGNGFTVDVAKHQLIVFSPCAEIGPVDVSDTFSTMLGLSWRYKPGSDQLGAMIKTLFTLKEFNENELIGLTQLGLHSKQNSGGGGHQNGEGEGQPMPENDNTEEVMLSHVLPSLKVTPNPFTHFLDIFFKGMPNSTVDMVLLDNNGKFVKVICTCSTNEIGEIEISEGNLDLLPGVYIIRAYEGETMLTEKLIKCE